MSFTSAHNDYLDPHLEDDENAGMDGWELVELDGRTTGYVRPETGEAVATLEDLPAHVQEFLASESREGRR